MTKNEILTKYNISTATLRNWKKLKYIDNLDDIDPSVIDKILKTKTGIRRNKRNSVDNIIPESYINDKKIIPIIEEILAIQKKFNVTNNEILIEAIHTILKNANLDVPGDVYEVLGNPSTNEDFLQAFSHISIKYEENNDFLGCLYMSLISIGKKDVNGIFYTPFSVVNKIIQSVTFKDKKGIADPGCGSGNFLIQAFKKMKNEGLDTATIISNLYGFDIDDIAVLLSKINIYVLDDGIIFDDIKIFKKDFLLDDLGLTFDVIIGNPPWGKKYTNQEKNVLKKKYDVSFSKLDSFSQFILRSFSYLNENGALSFVLPSSILNIAVHENIRRFLLNHKIEYITKIGREFEEIVTDVIIIKVINSPAPADNICLYNEEKIEQKIFLTNPYSNFLISDTTSTSIINKIKSYKSYHLTDNATYALGIVTGDNKKYISDEKNDGYEPIICGKEITRYNFDYAKISKYIKFEKENFQQVANEDLYRCKNKIIYKFIGKKLCFAVESRSTLTLNSANLICLDDSCDIHYISAILNSRITQLFFDDVYDTHKVLKNHIQSFYIPDFDDTLKNKISELSKNTKSTSNYNEEIEYIIYKELGFTEEEIKYIKNRF